MQFLLVTMVHKCLDFAVFSKNMMVYQYAKANGLPHNSTMLDQMWFMCSVVILWTHRNWIFLTCVKPQEFNIRGLYFMTEWRKFELRSQKLSRQGGSRLLFLLPRRQFTLSLVFRISWGWRGWNTAVNQRGGGGIHGITHGMSPRPQLPPPTHYSMKKAKYIQFQK
jgi:hypothetical protein